MCKKINVRIAAEEISKQTALESAKGKTPDLKSLRKAQGKYGSFCNRKSVGDNRTSTRSNSQLIDSRANQPQIHYFLSEYCIGTCVASQKGLLVDLPQRHSTTLFLISQTRPSSDSIGTFPFTNSPALTSFSGS